MSYALRASILIALESKRGSWCTLAWLAGRVVAPQRVIAPLCAELVEAQLVQAGTVYDGLTAVFGVDVVEEFPATHDAMQDGPDLGVCSGEGTSP